MSEWEVYILRDFAFAFAPEDRVLDIGCGYGEQMADIAALGSKVYGIDPASESLAKCRLRNLDVVKAGAENIPFEAKTFDGIICKVVLSYTNEETVVAEIGRIIKPGGRVYLISHGAGYYLKYLFEGESLKVRFYGFRSLANTWFRIVTGSCLPGFLGDTLYQSKKRLLKYFHSNQLVVTEDRACKSYYGLPVFIYHTLVSEVAVG